VNDANGSVITVSDRRAGGKDRRDAAALPTRPAADSAPVAPRREFRFSLLVGAGGALGSLARFALGGWVTTWAGAGFPWGTFAVNVLGSLAIGFVIRALAMRGAAGAEMRAFLAIGVCGGFTTFSTFDLEMLTLLQHGRAGMAAVYALGSVSACIGGVALGSVLAAQPGRASR
jgi:fluoride exporter